jgi:hypothetical protein
MMKSGKYFLRNLSYPLFLEGQQVTRTRCHKLLLVLLSTLLWLISVSMVHAGNNIWTSSGPADVDVLALAIDPITPTTLYAGTSDPAGSGRGGVYKSTNGGASWTAVNTGLGQFPTVYALAIDPSIPTTLYAGTIDAVFKSTNGGGSWVYISTSVSGSFRVLALAIDPITPALPMYIQY